MGLLRALTGWFVWIVDFERQWVGLLLDLGLIYTQLRYLHGAALEA